MSKILVLDDDLERMKHFKKNLNGCDLVLVETAKDAISAFKNHDEYGIVFLDHDLGGEQMVKSGDGTGYEVAVHINSILEGSNSNPYIILHSLNPVGRQNMCNVLVDRKNVHEYPRVWLAVAFLNTVVEYIKANYD